MRSVLFNTVHDSTILDIYIPELLEVMKIVNEELYSKLPYLNHLNLIRPSKSCSHIYLIV